MTLDELEKACAAREQTVNQFFQRELTEHDDVVLVFPLRWKPPARFPRGELLSSIGGARVRAISVLKLRKWIKWARTVQQEAA